MRFVWFSTSRREFFFGTKSVILVFIEKKIEPIIFCKVSGTDFGQVNLCEANYVKLQKITEVRIDDMVKFSPAIFFSDFSDYES